MSGVFVPIVWFLVIGIVWVSNIFYKSKEKQMMIEKGLSYEQIVELLRTKRDPFILLKLGVLIIFVGLGLGAGFLFSNWTGYQEWIPFSIVTMTGLGLLVSFLLTRKLKNGNGN